MNYTNLEQSRKLIELGLDPKTADLWLTEFQPMKQEGNSLKLVPDGEKTVSVSQLFGYLRENQFKYETN